jgi:hypothetical protein
MPGRLNLETLPIEVSGQPVGPIAAWEAWSQTVAGLLGGGKDVSPWAWDGKSGATPPPADPPLSGVSLPTIPDDFFADGDMGGEGGSTAADASSSIDWAGIAAALGLDI